MVKTESSMIALGRDAPDFTLPDATGIDYSKSDFDGQPLLVVFMCNHCPYVVHIADKLAEKCAEWEEAGVGVVGINSNDVENYPDDHPDHMLDEALQRGYSFPYLFDETQEVAKAYNAQCTPDFFLYDAEHKLAYRGQFDASRPGNGEATGDALDAAVKAVLGDGEMPEQVPSMGCNIKWKP